MDPADATQILVDAFEDVAREVQSLSDRNTILAHKLKYAHEQYSALASKYAPNAPDVSQTLAKLQMLPEIDNKLLNTNYVPLPRRVPGGSAQVELALRIREGRRAAKQLSGMSSRRGSTESRPRSRVTPVTSKTSSSSATVLEQDFTVPGKESDLRCPFSIARVRVTTDGSHNDDAVRNGARATSVDGTTPHHPADPICAAMLDDSQDESTAPTASKCPIRYLDKHSPEEIAHYVETHKHDLPRSHAICLRRNQANEEQIRKLDAKYGNLVSMIQDLSQLHAPMLPSNGQARVSGGDDQDEAEEHEERQAEPQSARVESWAQAVSVDDEERQEDQSSDRLSYFERPLKEIRVGESPSRPWGISVPVYDSHRGMPSEREEKAASPLVPSPIVVDEVFESSSAQATIPRCPFGYGAAKTPDPGTEMKHSASRSSHKWRTPDLDLVPDVEHEGSSLDGLPLPRAESDSSQRLQASYAHDEPSLRETFSQDVKVADVLAAAAAAQSTRRQEQNSQPSPTRTRADGSDGRSRASAPTVPKLPTQPPRLPSEIERALREALGLGSTTRSPALRPQVVFNGPVVIGYSAEEAARIAAAFASGDGDGKARQ